MATEPQPVRSPIGADSCVLVVGASRGLGLEFALQLARKGAQVFATYRGAQPTKELASLADSHPGRFHPIPLDVSNDESVVAALAMVQKIAKAPRPLSLVIHNAGIYGPAKGLGSLERDALLRVFEVNAVGPVLFAQKARALLRPPTAKGPCAVYSLLSSKMGSVDDNGSGGSYGYRMSKSALVIASKSLHIDLRGQAGGARAPSALPCSPCGASHTSALTVTVLCAVVCLHPGYVRTDMTGGAGLINVDESVRGMLKAIEATDGNTPFRWVDYKAEIVPF